MSPWRHRWRMLVGIDLRSLALLRISLAAILIYDLLARFGDLEAHYSDRGVLPRAELLQWKGDELVFSLHLLSGSVWLQGALFVIALFAAGCLLVGWHSRTMTVLSWVLLASVQARNPLILHGGDQLLRVMLFWAMFVPWGRLASLDGRRLGGRVMATALSPDAPYVVSVATLALKLQLCGMYWTTAALKWHPIWLEDGSAIAMALRLDQLVTPLGRSLTAYPDLLTWATHGTMVLEILGPALAFCPWLTAPLQLFTVVLFVGFHLLGLAPALYLGIFPFVCAACWSLFLPSAFWDRWCPGGLHRLGRAWQRGLEVLARALRLRRRPGRWRTPHGRTARWADGLLQVGLAFLVIYVALWNLRTVDFERYRHLLPEKANGVADVLQLGQLWNLFAPFPATEDGWFVFVGTLVDGDEVEVRSGGEVSFDKPQNVSRSFGNERWKKYLMNLDDRQNGLHRRFYGRYLCEEWNGRHRGGERLASIQMFVVRERTLPSGVEEAPRQGRLWQQVCVLDEVPSS